MSDLRTLPPRGLLEKAHKGSALNFTPPLRGLFPTEEHTKITPPLRGSQRGKDEVRSRVGGGRFIL